MEQKTTYNNLPERVEEILKQVKIIHAMLEKIPKVEEIPKYLSIDDSVEFLKTQGIKISKSTLYKRSSAGKLKSYKIEGKIYFKPNDLLDII